MAKGTVHIGTSGFSYKHWKEVFYPVNVPATKWLEYYSERFSTTEINSSFYHLPRITTIQKWAERVPENFYFCPKMSRFVTHMKKLHEPEDGFTKFFDAFESLRSKMGPVLLQLPPSLKFNEELAQHLYELCSSKYADYDFALEIRHESWLGKPSLTLMKKYNIALVIAESGGRFPYDETITAKHVYIRFHGPEQIYASSYSEKQLLHFAHLIDKWQKSGHSIWAYFNNDIYGYAIANANRLIEMIR